MADVDTSSYPKATLPTSPLDVAGKLGNLQAQSLQINQAKMDQANQAIQYLTRALSAIGPDGTADQYKRAGLDTARTFNIPTDMQHIWDNKIDESFKTTGNGRAFWNEAVNTGRQHSEILNSAVPPHTTTETGANTIFSRIPQQGQPSIIGNIPRQLPVTHPTVDQSDNTSPQYGQPRTIAPPPLPPTPGFNKLGIPLPLPAGAINPAVVPGMRPGEKAVSAQAMPATSGVPTAMSPDYETGLKQHNADQALAVSKLQNIKPLLQALPLMQDLKTGIGTETLNKILAGLHNVGMLPKEMTDKVTAYQELSKKLAAYVANSPIGQRSDAAQTLAEAQSPNPKTQINPALVQLAKDALTFDIGQAIRAPAFTSDRKDANGNPVSLPRRDYENYGTHMQTFPAQIDERAIGIPFMKDEEKNALLDKMEKEQNTIAGRKFKHTLELMGKLGLF